MVSSPQSSSFKLSSWSSVGIPLAFQTWCPQWFPWVLSCQGCHIQDWDFFFSLSSVGILLALSFRTLRNAHCIIPKATYFQIFQLNTGYTFSSPIIAILASYLQPLPVFIYSTWMSTWPITWHTAPKGKHQIWMCLHVENLWSEVDRPIEVIMEWAVNAVVKPKRGCNEEEAHTWTQNSFSQRNGASRVMGIFSSGISWWIYGWRSIGKKSLLSGLWY